mmetsp:Transcript_18303/g.31871  ORF Transcript_18303/g.31871 Transcript_18303/m.31871 type:complete len:198 (+) Transcript_18303:23-616(+)
MSELYKSLTPATPRYFDRKYPGGQEKYFKALDNSKTLYVGNLSFYTTEEQIYELFSTVGDLRRIIMGLDRQTKTPCGFCFVEYYERSSAEACMKYVNGTSLDERIIRTDFDPGFDDPDRQFGRGRSGGQVRDEYRADFDAGRGGYGRSLRQEPHAYTEFESAAPTSAGRKRDLDRGDDEPASKNPRFRRGDDDDDER